MDLLRIIWIIMQLHILASGTSRRTNLSAPSLELIHTIQDVTSGLVLLQCRNSSSLNCINITNVQFWRNRMSATDLSLRERDDVIVVQTADQLGIQLNLTQNMEGRYSCGRRIDASNVYGSAPVPLISHRRIIQLPDNMETTFTATTGSRATLHCPIQPGQLGQYYSVRWKKGSEVVAKLINSLTPMDTAPRHSIDRTDFSLIIEDVQLGDASSSYKCEVFVRDPLSYEGQTVTQLETNTRDALSLQINAPPMISSAPANIIQPAANFSEVSLSFNCSATGLPSPDITWTFIDAASGLQITLSTSTDHYKVESSNTATAMEDGLPVSHSTFTFLKVAANTVGKVVCKARQPGTESDEYTATAEALISIFNIDHEVMENPSKESSVQPEVIGVYVLAALVSLMLPVLIVIAVTLCMYIKLRRNQNTT